MRGDLNIDFMMAVILFVSVYALLYTVLPSATISFKKSPDALATASYFFSDVLTTTPGSPANWSTVGEASRIGFSYGSETTSYPNILDAGKVGAIDGVSCESLRGKTDITLDFAISVESDSRTYACTVTIPKNARIIERVGYLRNNSEFIPVKIKTWTW